MKDLSVLKYFKVLQDADTLDAIGAIRIARTFSVGRNRNRSLYNPSLWTSDHINKKMLILKNSMHTKIAKEMAKSRTEFLESFLKQLRSKSLKRQMEI